MNNALKKLAAICFLALCATGFSYAQGEFWVQTNGPFSGSVRAITTGNGNTVVAGTEVLGIFTTSDGGSHWKQVAPGFGNTVYALTHNSHGDIFAGGVGGVSRSTDSGESFSTLSIASSSIFSLAVDSSGNVYAGGSGSVYRSTDNGDTWTPVLSGGSGFVNGLAVNANGHVFAAKYISGFFRSTDHGDSWTAIDTGLTGSYYYPYNLTVKGSNVLISETSAGVCHSTNNGNSWILDSGLTHYRFTTFTSLPAGNLVAGTGNGDLYTSTDNATSWSPLRIGLTSQDAIASLEAVDDQTIFAGSTHTGIYRSTDAGTTWENSGFIVTTIMALAADLSGHLFAGAAPGGIFHSTDQGNTWSRSEGGLPQPPYSPYSNSIAIHPNGHIFTVLSSNSLSSSGIYRSTNDGDIWARLDSISDHFGPALLAISPNGIIYTTSGFGVFRSTDDGDHWILSDTGLGSSTLLAIVAKGTDTVFTAGEGGVFLSTDRGVHWTSANTGLADSNISSFAVGAGGNLLAGTSTGTICRSTNDGGEWFTVDSDWVGSTIPALFVAPDGEMFAAVSDAGVLHSTDNGTTWQQVETSLFNPIKSFAADLQGYLYAGTEGAGVVRSTKTVTSVTMSDRIIPNSFALIQNYPNPFNPSTKIRYSLQKAGHISLRVYDVLGREVDVLVNEQKQPGVYDVIFDGRNLPSGVYFYRLQFDSFSDTKKLLLLR